MSQNPYLPPGCKDSDLPGSRKCDYDWEAAVESVLINDIAEACIGCDCEFAECDDDGEFTGCGKGLLDSEGDPVEKADPQECTQFERLAQERFENISDGFSDPRCEPEYWED